MLAGVGRGPSDDMDFFDVMLKVLGGLLRLAGGLLVELWMLGMLPNTRFGRAVRTTFRVLLVLGVLLVVSWIVFGTWLVALTG